LVSGLTPYIYKAETETWDQRHSAALRSRYLPSVLAVLYELIRLSQDLRRWMDLSL